MISATGNDRDRARAAALLRQCSPLIRRFSLIEILVATSILALGMVALLQAYSVAINALQISRDNMDAILLVKEKAVEIEWQELSGKGLTQGTDRGDFDGHYTGFTWELKVLPSTVEELNEVNVDVSNHELRHLGHIRIITYAESKD